MTTNPTLNISTRCTSAPLPLVITTVAAPPHIHRTITTSIWYRSALDKDGDGFVEVPALIAGLDKFLDDDWRRANGEEGAMSTLTVAALIKVSAKGNHPSTSSTPSHDE